MIRQYAIDHNYIITTKDADFYEMNLVYGQPPKIIWIKAGNQTKAAIINLLIDNQKIIEQFPALHLIASGGVSSLDDLIELEEIGCAAAIVGKAIYENKITISELASFN